MDVKCPHCLTIKTIDKTDKNIQVRCATTDGGCGKKFYIKNNIVLLKQDIQDNNKTPQYKTTARNKGRDITIEVDYNVILKCMERGISTIKNKPEVKNKSGGYYWDYVAWTKEFEKLKLLEMGDEK